MGIARRIDDGTRSDGGPGKKDLARMKSRNAVIRRTAEGVDSGARNYAGTRSDVVGSVANGEVRTMLRPDHAVAWQTVDDAWTSLVEDWPCFTVDESGDEKRLTVTDVDAIPEDLVALVEHDVDDLSEGDLAKRLVGDGKE